MRPRHVQVFGSSRPQDVPSEPTQGDPAAKLTLVSFPRVGDCVTTLTPFGTKIEVALRLAGIEYEGVLGDLMNKSHSPKSKVRHTEHAPVLRDEHASAMRLCAAIHCVLQSCVVRSCVQSSV